MEGEGPGAMIALQLVMVGSGVRGTEIAVNGRVGKSAKGEEKRKKKRKNVL